MSWDWQIDEEWADVRGSESQMWVSNHGRVYRYDGFSKVAINQKGYPQVSVINRGTGGECRMVGIHVLVAEAFRGPRPHGQVARHLDDVKHNVFINNIDWGTRAQNGQDYQRNKNRRVGKAYLMLEKSLREQYGALQDEASELVTAAQQHLHAVQAAGGNSVQRTIAQGEFYKAVTEAASVLSPSEITKLTGLTRQRIHQIIRPYTPEDINAAAVQAATPAAAQLPETDV